MTQDIQDGEGDRELDGAEEQDGYGNGEGDGEEEQDEQDEQDEQNEAVAGLLSIRSEAVTEEVIVDILDPRGQPETKKVQLSHIAQVRLARHQVKRAKRDLAKALTEVQQFDRPSAYISMDTNDSCEACRTGDWACSIERYTNKGRLRTTNALVGVRCSMCTSGHCIWPDNRKNLSTELKAKMLEGWSERQEQVMAKRKIWFETVPNLSFGDSSSSSGSRGAGIGLNRSTSQHDQPETSDPESTSMSIPDTVDASISVRKRKPTTPPIVETSTTHRHPSDHISSVSTSASVRSIPEGKKQKQQSTSQSIPKPKSKPAQHTDGPTLVSEYTATELQSTPDFPHYYLSTPCTRLDRTGALKSPYARFKCPPITELPHMSILYPSIAKRFRLLSRETTMREGLIAILSNLVNTDPERYMSTDSDGQPQIVLPPYIYSSKLKCYCCANLGRAACYFGYIPSPTAESITSGSIPLGPCLACMSTGHVCVATIKGNGDKFPLGRWFGPIRASLLSNDFDCEDHTLTIVKARATSGPVRGPKAGPVDDGSFMVHLIRYLKDEAHRPQWQSIWALVSLLGQRLAGLLGVENDKPFVTDDDLGETDLDAVAGTLLSPSEVFTVLSLRGSRTVFESVTQTYPLDLAVALAIHAEPRGLSTLPRYIYPRPLSPNINQACDTSTAHTGPTTCLVAGLIILPSAFLSTRFRFGAWVIDPSETQPTIYTFGIPATSNAFQDPVALFGWSHVPEWTIHHLPSDSDQSEAASGPMAVEFLRLLCSSPIDANISDIARTVSSTSHEKIRKRHLTQYILDCESSKRIVRRLQDMEEDEISLLVKLVAGS